MTIQAAREKVEYSADEVKQLADRAVSESSHLSEDERAASWAKAVTHSRRLEWQRQLQHADLSRIRTVIVEAAQAGDVDFVIKAVKGIPLQDEHWGRRLLKSFLAVVDQWSKTFTKKQEWYRSGHRRSRRSDVPPHRSLVPVNYNGSISAQIFVDGEVVTLEDGVAALADQQRCELELTFQPGFAALQVYQADTTLRSRIQIGGGYDAGEVPFDLTFFGDGIRVPSPQVTVKVPLTSTFKWRSEIELLGQPAEYQLWIRVFQKTRLIDVLSLKLRINKRLDL